MPTRGQRPRWNFQRDDMAPDRKVVNFIRGNVMAVGLHDNRAVGSGDRHVTVKTGEASPEMARKLDHDRIFTGE